MGPSFLSLISNEVIQEIEFVFDLSLGFIAFAAGSELFFKEIKGTFNSIKWNTLSSILTTFTVGFILVFLTFNTLEYFENIQLDIKIYLSLLCASIFVARSPASAIAVINELRAKGKFTSTSMGVLCLSDFGVILLFAIIFSLIKSIDSGSLEIFNIIIIIFEIIISIAIGFIYGIILNLFLNISINKLLKYFLLVVIGFSAFLFSDYIREISLLIINKEIIFGLEPQSLSVASLLRSRDWIVDIVTFETNKSLKIPDGVNNIKIENIDKYNFDKLEYSKADSVICFCSDEINQEICTLSHSTYGNKNMIVRINDYLNSDLFSELNIKLIHPSDAIISLIDQYVRSPLGTSLFLGKEKDKEIRDIRLHNEKISGSLLRDLKLPRDVLMLSIKRNDEIILSHGYTRLLKEDIITFLGSRNSLDKLTLRFDS